MIDSGILSGTNLGNDFINLVTRAIAHQVGVPVCLVPTIHLAQIDELRGDLGLVIPDASSFDLFCAKAIPDGPKLIEFSKRLIAAGTAGLVQFPHPLYRHLKDHVAVRLYEVAKFLDITANRSGDIIIDEFVLAGCGFSTLATMRPEGLLIIGPVFLEQSSGEGTSRAYFDRFGEAITRFNRAIETFFRFREESNYRREPSLYTSEYLVRMAFSRQKLTTASAQRKFRFVEACIDRFHQISFPGVRESVPPLFFAKVAAGLAAIDDGNMPGLIHFKTFNSATAPTIATMSLSKDECRLVPATIKPTPNPPPFDAAYAAASETSFQNWNNAVTESLGQLRKWLTASRTPTGDENSVAVTRNFGRRLARFLASIFGAYECTIYRVIHTQQGRRMSSVGAFSGDQYGEERLAVMQAHMDSLQGSQQDSSISFRCANENKVQYCQYFDYKELKAIPLKQVITFPRHSRFKYWGSSACALPIRVNGRLWGVLQLIGNRPHVFPEVVRAKIEDACDIIGSHLFRTEMLDSIYKINHVIGDPDIVSNEKRAEIERALARMFGSKTFAIFRIDPADPQRPVNVFLEVGRADLREVPARSDDGDDYFTPFINFARSSEESWHAKIGSDFFRRRFGNVARRKFYDKSEGDFAVLVKMSWDLSATGAVPGVVMLTYDHAMVEQENWRETIEFICQYISTITGSLYSSDLWERRLREKLGHELSKTAHNLQSSISRLGEPRFRQDQPSGVKHVIAAVVGDLGRHSKALEKYVQILTKHRDITDFDNDPRLYIIARLRSDYRTEKGKRGISFREAYNYAFIGQKERFDQRKIAVPRLDPAHDFWVDMDELCLREVLTSLVDNIVKYTRPETSITLREDSTDRLRGIVISNIGLRLDEEEVNTIFDDEVRGRKARELLPTEGSGFGLWYAQRALHVWNCGLRHNQRELKERNDDYTWHNFTLGFLRRMVKD